MKTALAFCATEQIDTDHNVSIDNNGEYVFRCECGSFFKIAGHLGKKEIFAIIDKEREANAGQVSMAKIEAENVKKLSIFDDAE